MSWQTAVIFTAAGSGVGVLGWHVLRRARSPAPVPAAPVVVATGLLWLVVASRWLAGAWPAWWLPVPLTVAALAVPLTIADLRHRRLPDVLTLPAYPVLGLVLAVAALSGPGAELAVRALVAGVAFGGLHLLVHAL